jgi:hypothetical protein
MRDLPDQAVRRRHTVAGTRIARRDMTLGIKWQPAMILKALGVVLIVAGLELIAVYQWSTYASH